MDSIMDLMRARHSVRQYENKPIPPALREELDALAAELSRQGDLHIQILYDEPDCFNSRRAHYGKFENCANYIALVGKKAPDLEERCGYYGEKLVLKAQELGLNTCWVALTHGKSRAVTEKGEKEVILIALGYGKTQGSPRKSKTPAEVSDLRDDAPFWFRRGVEAALLVPPGRRGRPSGPHRGQPAALPDHKGRTQGQHQGRSHGPLPPDRPRHRQMPLRPRRRRRQLHLGRQALNLRRTTQNKTRKPLFNDFRVFWLPLLDSNQRHTD